MEMENSRRPTLDRSREPGLKRPRLAEEASNPNGRPFQQQQQRPANSGGTVSTVSRLRSSERERDSDDTSVPRSYQHQQQYQQQHQELVTQYKTALAELTFNSKPIITNLTIIAGENLHAAKAIAATVCANILEVPSEQKLPSLYLLDSIVKNIGRDYIKYFGARVPEVFCKAYRQVGPSIHPGMRHLFGTWKGVFPPQPLQIIEKELGFSSAINGNSSGSSTSRPDLQCQRQPHSIHVNPKYLEARQRLQQSTKPEDTADDNITEHVTRPDKTTNFGAQRSWADSSVKIQREAVTESGQEQQMSAGYGDYEYGDGLSRHLSPGIGRSVGRITEQGYDKRWFGSSRGVEESITSQRMPSAQNVGGRSSGEMSRNWKNSEEEEYMWDNLNTGVTNRGVVGSTRKGHLTPDDLEKVVRSGKSDEMELESRLPKWQNQLEAGSRNGTDIFSDSLTTEQKEQAPFWNQRASQGRLEGPYSIESSNISNRKSGFRSQMGQSKLGAYTVSGSIGTVGQRHPSPGKSPMHQKLSSSSFPSRDPHQIFAEKDHLQDQSLSLSDHKTTVFPRQMDVEPYNQNVQDTIPGIHQNTQLGNMRKSQPLTLQKSSPLRPSFQPRHHDPSSQQPPLDHLEAESSSQSHKPLHLLGSLSVERNSSLDHLNPIPRESPVQSNTAGLLAAVTKSENLSNSSASAGPPPSESTSVGLRSAAMSIPQTKMERPSAQTSNLASSVSNPISSLLNTLVSKGLVSASKSESTLVSPRLLNQPQNHSVAIATTSTIDVPPVSVSPSVPSRPTKDKVSSPESAGASSGSAPETTYKESENFIGFEFKPDVLRQSHASVIDGLLDNLPYSCSICGLRFKLQQRLDRHLEWHSLKNSEPDNLTKPTRGWYSNSVDWIARSEGYPATGPMEEPVELAQDNIKMVPADETQCACLLCGEVFEDIYSQERDEWMFKDAAYLTIPSGNSERKSSSMTDSLGLIVHIKCMSETSINYLGLVNDVKVEETI
ncbi:hypothetical protein Nepgr_028166 [Nepenthes gracilis]|uniref:CID domain-containing protein n=1 Tax=Nepenthes gracilis TaxID=150966 RepID=A0AAD3Y257_NEPGR|nr:hypothetical protein Nepgr_028166 [Nepenthes gracilis]